MPIKKIFGKLFLAYSIFVSVFLTVLFATMAHLINFVKNYINSAEEKQTDIVEFGLFEGAILAIVIEILFIFLKIERNFKKQNKISKRRHEQSSMLPSLGLGLKSKSLVNNYNQNPYYKNYINITLLHLKAIDLLSKEALQFDYEEKKFIEK